MYPLSSPVLLLCLFIMFVKGLKGDKSADSMSYLCKIKGGGSGSGCGGGSGSSRSAGDGSS